MTPMTLMSLFIVLYFICQLSLITLGDHLSQLSYHQHLSYSESLFLPISRYFLVQLVLHWLTNFQELGLTPVLCVCVCVCVCVSVYVCVSYVHFINNLTFFSLEVYLHPNISDLIATKTK